jgi:hypothetical protein
MELTRRNAVAALAALGVGATAGVSWQRLDDSSGEDLPDNERVRAVMTAVAETVYPPAVTGTAAFVETFLAGRLDRPDHGRGIREAVATTDEQALAWYDTGVTELDADGRDQLLREMGVDAADEDPTGTTAQRVRYYVVNELLLALYASPTGGRLAGIENPQGHPGGTASYQQGPDR